MSIVDYHSLLLFLVTFISMKEISTREDLAGFSLRFFEPLTIDETNTEKTVFNIFLAKSMLSTSLLFHDHDLAEHDRNHLYSPLHTIMNNFILHSIALLVFSNLDTDLDQRSTELGGNAICLLSWFARCSTLILIIEIKEFSFYSLTIQGKSMKGKANRMIDAHRQVHFSLERRETFRFPS